LQHVLDTELGSFIKMIRHGATCFAEIGVNHNLIDVVGKAMEEIGIRATIAKARHDQQTPMKVKSEPLSRRKAQLLESG
jgi:hypothetical protein